MEDVFLILECSVEISFNIWSSFETAGKVVLYSRWIGCHGGRGGGVVLLAPSHTQVIFYHWPCPIVANKSLSSNRPPASICYLALWSSPLINCSTHQKSHIKSFLSHTVTHLGLTCFSYKPQQILFFCNSSTCSYNVWFNTCISTHRALPHRR